MTQQSQLGSSGRYDVVIVGGGPAGLSGALLLGHARRSTLVIDSGQPRNAPAAHMYGFLSRDGVPPGHLLEAGRQEVAGYQGEVITGRARSASRDGDGFAFELDTGRTVRARRLLVTTGITDELPDIPGLAARWGRDVPALPLLPRLGGPGPADRRPGHQPDEHAPGPAVARGSDQRRPHHRGHPPRRAAPVVRDRVTEVAHLR